MPLLFQPPSRLHNHDRPYLTLTVLFMLWKALLSSLVILAPAPGYDTSTTLLPPLDSIYHDGSLSSRVARLIATKFVRWDAIYFTQTAKRGYVYEQEWAFGWGHTQFLGFVTRFLFWSEEVETQQIAIVGVLLSHIFHWASVLVLFELTKDVFYPALNYGIEAIDPRIAQKTSSFALLVSVLHILSPAGVFLSAPYAEALFSLLNFVGFWAYVKSTRLNKGKGPRPHALAPGHPGVTFGMATTVRGNGLFSGVLFAYDACTGFWEATGIGRRHLRHPGMKTVFAIGGGTMMAAIAILPQLLAYQDFCASRSLGERQEWCGAIPPSIYTWVQKEYWGVRLLGYWTLSNIPLFLLAAPMLGIMARSCFWAWSSVRPTSEDKPSQTTQSTKPRSDHDLDQVSDSEIIFKISLPQLVLAVLAFTTYHVQVITRLSSGYPVWYWWLARLLQEVTGHQRSTKSMKLGRAVVIWTVAYAIIQGGLFASFLPPA